MLRAPAVPGVLVLGGLAAALVWWWRRAARPVAWAVLAYALLVAFLGPLLQLPAAVMNSPLQLTPAMPLETAGGGTLPLLLIVALLLGGVGMVGLRRRDLAG